MRLLNLVNLTSCLTQFNSIPVYHTLLITGLIIMPINYPGLGGLPDPPSHNSSFANSIYNPTMQNFYDSVRPREGSDYKQLRETYQQNTRLAKQKQAFNDPQEIPVLGSTIRLTDNRPEATERNNFTGDYGKALIERVIINAKNHGVDPNIILSQAIREGAMRWDSYSGRTGSFGINYPAKKKFTNPVADDFLTEQPATEKSKRHFDDFSTDARDASARLRAAKVKYPDNELMQLQEYGGFGYTRPNSYGSRKALPWREFPYAKGVQSINKGMVGNNQQVQELIRQLSSR